MSKVKNAIKDMHVLDELAAKKTFMTEIHPVVKLLLTVFYIIIVVSFSKYNLTGLLSMAVVLIIMFELSEIPVKLVVKQLKVLLGLLFLVGIFNPVFDRTVIADWNGIQVTGGMISCATLYLKGIMALSASYILIASTGMEQICYAMQVLHMPKILTTVIMLIYRYIMLFLKEVDRVSLAYSMRAPHQKGINIKVWGSLAGAMLLRSVDRSEVVYHSMVLRGFNGTFRLNNSNEINIKRSIIYGLIMIVLVIVLRIVPVFELIGNFI